MKKTKLWKRRQRGFATAEALIGLFVFWAVITAVVVSVINPPTPAPQLCPVCGVAAPCYNHQVSAQ